MKKSRLSHLCLLWPWLCLCLLSCGPKVAPVVTPATPPPTVFEQKMRWILQLEDERQLRGGGGDLLALLQDPEARIRRRAALAGSFETHAVSKPPIQPNAPISLFTSAINLMPRSMSSVSTLPMISF